MPKGYSIPLTDEQKEYIRQWYAGAIRRVAKSLGIPTARVGSFIVQLHKEEDTFLYKNEPWTGAMICQMREMAENGSTIPEIATYFKKSYAAVYRVMSEHGIKATRAAHGEARVAKSQFRKRPQRLRIYILDKVFPDPKGPLTKRNAEIYKELTAKNEPTRLDLYRALLYGYSLAPNTIL